MGKKKKRNKEKKTGVVNINLAESPKTTPMEETEQRERSVAEIKKFVEWRDRSGNLEYTFGEVFGMKDEKINKLGADAGGPMIRIRNRYMNNRIGSIGIAIKVLEDVLELEEYSPDSLLKVPGYTPEQVVKLALILQSLDHLAQERLVQGFMRNQRMQKKQAEAEEKEQRKKAPKPPQEIVEEQLTT